FLLSLVAATPRCPESVRGSRGVLMEVVGPVASSLATTFESVSCISIGFWIGPSTCSRSVAARPSQKNELFQARLNSGIALRVPALPSAPRLTARPLSAPAAARSWHEAQDWPLFTESRVSL